MKLVLLFLAISAVTHCISVDAPSNNFLGPAPAASTQFAQVNSGISFNPNEYYDVNVTALPANIETALSFGISKVLGEAIQRHSISVTDFNISEIKRIQKEVTGAGDSLRFEVVLTNPRGDVINTNFTVYTRARDQARNLESYNYQIQTQTVVRPPEPTGTWSLVAPEQANGNANIGRSLSLGLQKALEQLRAEGRVDTSSLTNVPPNVKSVEQQGPTGNTTFYRFNVEIANTQLNFTTTFVVAFDQAPAMRSLLYKVESVNQPSSSQSDADGFTPIQVVDVSNDQAANACLEFGVSEILRRAFGDRQAPLSVYTLTAIENAAKKTVGATAYYRFNVELGNGQGGVIKASYTVKYNTGTTNKELQAFNYRAENTRTTTTTTTTTTTRAG